MEAYAASYAELDRWIPWVLEGSEDEAVLREKLATYEQHFEEGGDALYAIYDLSESEILGGIGLYRRVGPGGLEVGYWIRTDHAGHGLATLATVAVTEAALTLPGIDRVEVHCDPENVASTAIPRKLGFRLRETRTDQIVQQSGKRGDTMIWEITSQMVSMAYARV